MTGILLTAELDLAVSQAEDGKPALAIGDNSEQCAQLVVTTEKGEWKEYPLQGVGIRKYINTQNGDAMIRDVKVQLMSIGLAGSVDIEDNKVKINLKRD